jgi:anhydro-N-acetylmuramic acid kinase
MAKEKGKIFKAIGLMSGTSLDGVDAALLETDGYGYVEPLGFVSLPYDRETRDKLRACLGARVKGDMRLREASQLLTLRHIEAVKKLRAKADVIGFHGQTITHDPANKFTLQIGDAEMLARETGMDVVSDFRSADVLAGGQGAPFLPLYHRARVQAAKLAQPVAVLNLGGVGNVTYINSDEILAFDTGPGNALIDDFVSEVVGADFDKDGKIAAAGNADQNIVQKLLAHDFFKTKPPKSLDRNAWDINAVKGMAAEHGAATLASFTVQAVKKALEYLPAKPKEWLVTGGGRHNKFIMRELVKALEAPVKPVEDKGWNGDAMEAEGFAYLAVRSLLKEPLSLPTTTGVPKPITGGVYTAA